MSDFFGKLKSGAGKVAFEAEKMNRLNRAKGELEQLKKQIEAQFSELGELYYRQHATIGTSGQAYDEICQSIVQLEQQVTTKNEDIQRISAETYNAPAPSAPVVQPADPSPIQFNAPQTPKSVQPVPATKFCTNCGKEMAATVKFCPDCGTKMA